MTQQSNTKQALATVLGTVTATFGTVNSSIGMLNRKVTDMAVRQDITSRIDMHLFKATIQQEKAKELAESRLTMKQYMDKSPEHAQFYESAFNEITPVLAPKPATP